MQRDQTSDLSGDLKNVHFGSATRAPVAPMLSLYCVSSAMDVDNENRTTQIADSNALTVPPNSPWQPLDVARMTQPPLNTEPQAMVTLHGFFGSEGPAAQVKGTPTALQTLAMAISNDLKVFTGASDGDMIVESALLPLHIRGVVPDYRANGILEVQDATEAAALGLTPDQFALSPEEMRVLDTAYPPFLSQIRDDSKYFDIAKLLVMLKVFARYFQHTGKRYQVLVLTKMEGTQVLDAKVFSTQEGANETVFLYRNITFNGFFGGAPSYEEAWMPISLGHDAPRPARELDILGRPAGQYVDQYEKQAIRQPSKTKKPKRAPAPQNTTPAQSSGPRNRAKPIHSGIDVSAYHGMTPAEVFTAVEQELAAGTITTDEVAGERLLLFAIACSNREIRDLLHPYCERNFETLPSDNNVYNGRILPAIKRALKPGQSFEKAKVEFDDARKAHNLKTTSGLRGKSTKEVKISSLPRKSQRAVKYDEPADEEPEADMSDDDMVDDGEATPAPTPRPTRSTRGAKPRASYRATADESEDEEMDDADDTEQDRAKARYKRAKMDKDDEDDEDADFELDA
ncbi:hypothetical protein CLAFUW4_02438 [Fulvia fulva]|uniref:Uncharacterized protein n=1 Tax=Passalora fulva TaxID=5499 RepID=A0A9Q8P5P0_PASFU|nr:uncharacterized protein CLAFUR5_02428 [Fulvia fulva]KAK4632240.1 hypothetical protein CLAFUR4_02433 [Fulvia fulva]KAK4633211.1 hypothetical protein CLAFUR0_02437 [Fulvia fulva]UJO14325.1 hypothetical protein CLAFUR5_02428 [Fulvia fulva]WPV10763.1 hypothetical protein CLAFUW4_02438 [Fulvia fulva]WPV25688.1 hypothetical protein CLAFUW7_02438 [Fulvia fulva]